jgi:ribosomal protein S2
VHLAGSYSTEVNAVKAKCTFISCAQNARQIHKAEMARKSFETVANYQSLGGTLTDENCIREEIKRRLNGEMLIAVLFSLFCSPVRYVKGL